MTWFQVIVAALLIGLSTGAVHSVFNAAKDMRIAQLNKEISEWKVKAMHYDALIIKWNALVKKINARGGQEFLDGYKQPLLGFTAKELKQLVLLCHPDKHAGSEIAQNITRKLLEMRK